MKASEIQVGNIYRINHFGQLSDVKVLQIYTFDGTFHQHKTTRYHCLKLSTNKEITVKSAAKFQKLVYGVGTEEVGGNK